MRASITTLIIAATLTTSAAAASRKVFEVTFEDVPGGGLVCDVVFFGKPPAPATVDKIVRSALESAVLVDSSRDILAMAFVGDEAMKQTQYSGSLVYKAADKRIMTMDEFRGVKRSGQDTGAYYIESKEDKTLQGIKPERRWLSLTLVFPEAPSIQHAYDVALVEAEKAAQRGLDVNVYVSVGDKTTRTSWRQLRDPSGGYVFVEYQVSTKTIKRQTKVLKKLQ
ncbi:MAG TPA: hypothetical protein VFT34_18370 [Verrucomicrobiae bacterium]|nr:hypothetical protein [Verrucomicrobiae bacterium]